MTKIRLSRIEISAFKILSYAGPSVLRKGSLIFENFAFLKITYRQMDPSGLTLKR